MTAFEDFVVGELPKRSALETVVTVSYDGDPNDVAAPAQLKGAPLGSWFREDTAAKWWRKIGGGATDWEEQGGGGGGAVAQARTLYVGKHGLDANDGTNVDLAKLTIGSAVTAATALTPTVGAPVVIRILDAGIYDEAVTLPAYVSLDGPNADVTRSQTGVDTVTANAGCVVRLRKVGCGGTNAFAITSASAATGTIYFDIVEIIGTSNGEPISNRGAGATMAVKADLAQTSYRGVLETKSAAAVYLDIQSMVLAASGTYGILNGYGAAVTGRIGSIRKASGGLTGTFGVAGGIPTTLICGEVEADTAIDASFGNTINMVVGRLSGTVGGAGTVNVLRADVASGDMVGPASATNQALALFDGTTGKLIKNSTYTVSGNQFNSPTTGLFVPPTGGFSGSTRIGGATIANTSCVGVGEQSVAGHASVGGSSVAVGQLARAPTRQSVAVGAGSNIPSGEQSVVIGNSSIAKDRAVCVGRFSNAENSAVCIGALANAESTSVSVGQNAQCGSSQGVVVGRAGVIGAPSTGDNKGSIAIGFQSAIAGGGAGCNAAIAIGENASVGAGATNGIAVGPAAAVSAAAVDGVAFGRSAVSAAYGVAFGTSSTVGVNGVALGNSCRADLESVCVGQSGLADSSYTTAVGQNVTARGDSQVVLGHDAVGSDVGNEGICIGRLSRAYDTGVVAIGYNAQTTTSAEYSVIIGHQVQSNVANAVAVGRSASPGAEDTVVVGRSAIVHTPASGNSTGAIAIGGSATVGGAVAAGCSKGIAIGESSSLSAGATDGVAIGGGASVTATRGIAIGQSASSGNSGVAIGRFASTGSNSLGVAVGTTSALGSDNCVAVGYGANVGGSSTGGVAIGYAATVSAANAAAVAIGRAATSTAAGRCTIGTIGGSYDLELQFGKGLAAWGATPPASQPTKINDPTDLATCITALTAIIDVLEGAGLSSAT